MSLEPGDLLGPYRIQALLGTGRRGVVYRARDTRLGRDAALKVIAPRLLGDPSLRRRFEIEARAICPESSSDREFEMVSRDRSQRKLFTTEAHRALRSLRDLCVSVVNT